MTMSESKSNCSKELISQVREDALQHQMTRVVRTIFAQSKSLQNIVFCVGRLNIFLNI